MATHVTYEAAMANLRSMFADTDPDLIAMILQQNRGHLERTVEQLLGLTGGAPANTLSVPVTGGGARRRSSAADTGTPTVGGSNLPDDFLRAPSYFANRYGGGSRTGQSQIDQDAILAQMLQDELFMAELQANPEYYEDAYVPQPQQHPAVSGIPSQSHAHSQPQPYPISQSAAPSHGGAARGDFSGMGTGVGGPSAQSQSFKDRWNGLTAAAKKRLLTVANKMKSTSDPNAKAKDYQMDRKDLQSGLLSDSDAVVPNDDDSNLLGRHKSSDAVHERDIEVSTREVGDGVYTNNNADDSDLSEDAGRGGGYVPPSMTASLATGGTKRWGKMSDE